ncbi:MAG: peptidoglycan-associated lipoprotein Pal, partial [Candidatus Omnitrophica bacterium]|nr:peptidoglycan-associated lipoprotein Pal [Candidatus Omnitrophota bacterium]
YFDFDRYNIKTSEQKKLKILAEYLRNNPEISILIEGHCDERGSDEYNLVLGEKRALSARSFLIGLGIAPARLYTISYGESKPVDPGHNEEAWAKNRRAEFKIKQ